MTYLSQIPQLSAKNLHEGSSAKSGWKRNQHNGNDIKPERGLSKNKLTNSRHIPISLDQKPTNDVNGLKAYEKVFNLTAFQWYFKCCFIILVHIRRASTRV